MKFVSLVAITLWRKSIKGDQPRGYFLPLEVCRFHVQSSSDMDRQQKREFDTHAEREREMSTYYIA